jgi:hypothetical protein
MQLFMIGGETAVTSRITVLSVTLQVSHISYLKSDVLVMVILRSLSDIPIYSATLSTQLAVDHGKGRGDMLGDLGMDSTVHDQCMVGSFRGLLVHEVTTNNFDFSRA